MPVLHQLFDRVDLQVPTALNDWDARVATWLDEYYGQWSDAYVTEIVVDIAVFLFDHRNERVVLAYAVSTGPLMARDAGRMRGYPDVNRSVQHALGTKAFPVDRGHFLGHASGGRMDINLFPHRRELNRGWSVSGKAFREMERHVAGRPGTFFYHRPLYDDETDIPDILEYGVLVDGTDWWVGRFENKNGDAR